MNTARDRVLVVGSINIDHVYRVEHIPRPGETVQSRTLEIFQGGKGANQAVAAARAGAQVTLGGRVGGDAAWLLRNLSEDGIDTALVDRGGTRTGHAIVIVDDAGENSIVTHGGANHEVSTAYIDLMLTGLAADHGLLVLQGELPHPQRLIERGRARGLDIVFNPSPLNEDVTAVAIEEVDTLVVNETEAVALAGEPDVETALATLGERVPAGEIVLTRGTQGSTYLHAGVRIDRPAVEVDAVDTTGAGDTFIGFFVAARVAGESVDLALDLAAHAAAIAVGREGAASSIPTRSEVLRSLGEIDA